MTTSEAEVRRLKRRVKALESTLLNALLCPGNTLVRTGDPDAKALCESCERAIRIVLHGPPKKKS